MARWLREHLAFLMGVRKGPAPCPTQQQLLQQQQQQQLFQHQQQLEEQQQVQQQQQEQQQQQQLSPAAETEERSPAPSPPQQPGTPPQNNQQQQQQQQQQQAKHVAPNAAVPYYAFGSALERLKAVCSGREDEASETIVESGPQSEPKYVSPRQRLIRVEGAEQSRDRDRDRDRLNQAKETPGRTEDSPKGKNEVSIVDDYADPYDAPMVRRDSRHTQPQQQHRNDGYMEPYEAQRMMAEIRKQSSLERAQPSAPLYDNPYEPLRQNGVFPQLMEEVAVQAHDGSSDAAGRMAHGHTAQTSRESHLPQDDERPPDEYEEPWEWKRAPFSKALVQLESGSERAVRSAGDDDRRLCRPCHLGPPLGLKGPPGINAEHFTPIGEKIDPNLPLESQVWYHGAISRADAENLLRLCKESSYLVRNSETSKNEYSLSLKSSQGFMHMKLTRSKDGLYVLGQNSPPFSAIPEVGKEWLSMYPCRPDSHASSAGRWHDIVMSCIPVMGTQVWTRSQQQDYITGGVAKCTDRCI
uniref:SH2 domain-containing adapter protein F-like isoform X2 n=1 Tax=Myxine glutinosa TaxID=7769 RepID=UPI00358F59A1